MVIDTVEKATFVSLDVANSPRNIDQIADFTYVGHVYMESSGNYPIDVSANAAVGDTTIREYFSLAAGRAANRWSGQSFDGRFSVVGNPEQYPMTNLCLSLILPCLIEVFMIKHHMFWEMKILNLINLSKSVWLMRETMLQSIEEKWINMGRTTPLVKMEKFLHYQKKPVTLN